MIKGYFNGQCWPNPNGQMSYAFNVKSGNQILFSENDYSDKGSNEFPTSNNKAQYWALISLLEWLTMNNYSKDDIIIYGDSKLVINQMNDEMRIGNGIYEYYANTAKNMQVKFHNIKFNWISSEDNGETEYVAKQVLRDLGLKEPTFYKKVANTQQTLKII